MKQCILLIGISLLWTEAVEVNRTAEGYPAGFLPVCPGSEKPARIIRSLLNKLQFVVEGKSSSGLYRKYYPYFSAVEGIASDPHIDFKRKKTMVFVSGWLDTTTISPFPRVMGRAYVKLKYNVILLDTNRFTTFAYPVAARLSRDVGRRAARVLADLVPHGLDPKRTQLIGLSLGGQVISYIAKNFRNITGVSIDRITALDPAGPCFRTLPPDDRIDVTDADHVDIIHTNIDAYGLATPVGHVDFYINGGEFQPGDVEVIPCTSLCSHLRSYFNWLMALERPNSFIGLKCNSVQEARDGDCYKNQPLETNVMGPNTDFKKPGIYYVSTTNIFPYGLGEGGLKEENEFWKLHTRKFNMGDVQF